jgi:hypothetical protein
VVCVGAVALASEFRSWGWPGRVLEP